MLNNVLLKTLRDKRKTFIWWSLGILLLMIFYSSMFTSFKGSLSDFNQMMESNIIKAFLGEAPDLSTPEGWLGVELLPLLGPLIFIVFSVSFATSELTGEEDKGTLNLLLAHPISRTTVFLHKFSAMVLVMVALGIVFWLSNVLGTSLASMGISFLSLAEATFSLILLGLLFGTLALALGALTGKRAVGIGVTSAFGIASYLLNSMAEIIQGLAPYRPVSVFYHYGGTAVLESGIEFKGVGVFLGGTIVLLLIGVYGFGRREIGT
jgi:ABC-2 type transport system permease protein